METRQFQTGATRDTDNGKLDYEGFISPLVKRAYAKYMHKCRTRNVPEGQKLRDSDNWQKGIPQEVYAKSLIRHVEEFGIIFDGYVAYDEKGKEISLDDVLGAILFNAMGYWFENLKRTEMHQSWARPIKALVEDVPSVPVGLAQESTPGKVAAAQQRP